MAAIKNANMPRLIGFVDYGIDRVIIPPTAVGACHAAMEAWTGSRFDGLIDALDAHYHRFELSPDDSLRLDWIKLETEWPDLERLYRFLAPFVLPGGFVWCADEEQRHICYQFKHSCVYRVEGRVVYDDRATEL